MVGLIEILKVIYAFLQFPEAFRWLMEQINGTPEEQHVKLLAGLRAAFDKAKETKGDTSDIEKLISGS